MAYLLCFECGDNLLFSLLFFFTSNAHGKYEALLPYAQLHYY